MICSTSGSCLQWIIWSLAKTWFCSPDMWCCAEAWMCSGTISVCCTRAWRSCQIPPLSFWNCKYKMQIRSNDQIYSDVSFFIICHWLKHHSGISSFIHWSTMFSYQLSTFIFALDPNWFQTFQEESINCGIFVSNKRARQKHGQTPAHPPHLPAELWNCCFFWKRDNRSNRSQTLDKH